MKNTICSILYFMIQVWSSILFTVNGFGIDTWQWWAQVLGIFIAYLLGVLRGTDFE